MAFGDGDFEGGGVAGECGVEGGGVISVLALGRRMVTNVVFGFLLQQVADGGGRLYRQYRVILAKVFVHNA